MNEPKYLARRHFVAAPGVALGATTMGRFDMATGLASNLVVRPPDRLLWGALPTAPPLRPLSPNAQFPFSPTPYPTTPYKTQCPSNPQ